jgi:outer membrane protein OmpA-like peptidoglycan-associated protein
LGVILLFYFIRGCNRKPEAAVTPPVDTTTAAPTVVDTTAASMPARESFQVKLADGTEINAYKGGIEDMLVTCLNDVNCKAGKDKWFDFDNINFEMGSAAITPESQAQINNIVAILKAYPKARIKIGGYTDKTGDPAANKTLSQQRAEAVLNAIKAAGAKEAQLVGAEGYGSAFAKVPATASDEERKKDRRIAVQLREK